VQTIISIQFLRALAAIGVVASHFQFDLSRAIGAEAPHPELYLGNAGVDLFFVISGFVMVYASERLFAQFNGALTFFVHRVIRIVPLYWLATGTYLLIATFLPAYAREITADATLKSLFFIPYLRADGVVQPIVGQGWTLNYEMLFYSIFAFSACFPRGAAVAVATSILIGSVVAGLLFSPLPVVPAFWCDPIILEFVLGMLLALAYRRGLRLPPLACNCLMVAGAASLVILTKYVPNGFAWRPITWGLPAALVVAGATLREFSPAGPLWRALAVVGDASYALYLFHSFPVRAVTQFVRWSQIELAGVYWLLLALAVAGAITMACILHFVIERPVTRMLRQHFGPAGPLATPTPVETGKLP
jgi:exopolysaccharide production protein ExoZ